MITELFVRNKLLLILLLIPNFAWGIETDKAAHLGLSFTANTILYGFNHKVLKLPRKTSLILSMVETMAIGMVKELAIDSKPDGGDILANTAGIVGSGLIIWTFEF